MQKLVRLQTTSSVRRGVTLTEVLISMMIMAVGVLMVMSLFPIAALRTLQATQLTNAAILRYNVEPVIAQDPDLIFDPDRDGNFDEHFRVNGRRNYIIDPLGFHTFIADGLPGIANTFGNDGGLTPASVPGFSIPRFGGGLDVLSGSTDINALRLLATSFSSHPDGWSTDIDTFATGVETDGTGMIIGVQLGNLSASELANIGTSETLNTNIPFVGEVPDPEQYRIIVFDEDERISQAFALTYLTLGSVPQAFWSEDSGAGSVDFNGNGRSDTRYLPVQFNGTVGRVLLQSRRTSEFTWMLSVRRRADLTRDALSVDVVVRFKNGVDAKDEELFPANCLGRTNIIGVINNGANEPRLKKGGFAFDVVNAVWYRITSVQEKPAFGGAGDFDWNVYDYRVTLETEILALESSGADSFDDGLLNGSDVSAFGRVMFPTGVIEVYPLGSREFPDSLR